MFVAPLDLFSANDRLSTSLQWVCWAQSFGINDRSVGTWLCCEIKITACCDLFWHLEMMIMEQIDREKKYSTVAAMLKCSHQLMSSWQHRHHQKHPALLNKMKKKKKMLAFYRALYWGTANSNQIFPTMAASDLKYLTGETGKLVSHRKLDVFGKFSTSP